MLNHTQVSDAGLAHLNGLTKIIFLGLNGTQVTDAGMTHVMGMKKLKGLGLRGTRVSQAGFNKLKKAFPFCGIEHPHWR